MKKIIYRNINEGHLTEISIVSFIWKDANENEKISSKFVIVDGDDIQDGDVDWLVLMLTDSCSGITDIYEGDFKYDEFYNGIKNASKQLSEISLDADEIIARIIDNK